MGPELVGAESDLAFSVERAPVCEDAVDGLLFLSREFRWRSALGAVVVRWCLVECLGVLQHVEGIGEVAGHDVGDKPGDVLGVENDVSSKAGFEKVACEHEIDIELEAGVVEDDIDAAVFLATALGFLEHAESGVEVVGDDLLLVCFARVGAL